MTNIQSENEEEIRPGGHGGHEGGHGGGFHGGGHGGGFHGGHGGFYPGGGFYNPYIVPIVITDGDY